jgi:hypothetical protein
VNERVFVVGCEIIHVLVVGDKHTHAIYHFGQTPSRDLQLGTDTIDLHFAEVSIHGRKLDFFIHERKCVSHR